MSQQTTSHPKLFSRLLSLLTRLENYSDEAYKVIDDTLTTNNIPLKGTLLKMENTLIMESSHSKLNMLSEQIDLFEGILSSITSIHFPCRCGLTYSSRIDELIDNLNRIEPIILNNQLQDQLDAFKALDKLI